MKIKVIADCSCDITSIPGVDFEVVPLTISTNEREFVDDENLDVNEMINYLATYNGTSRSACPSIGTWLDAFDGADIVYVATITGGMSGSYNSAMNAKEMYLQSNPEAKVEVFDTLSAGPEVRLVIEKVAELVKEGKEFEEVCSKVHEYMKTTRLFFSLSSLHNLAQNGRVNKILASAVGVLGIRVFGTASEEGQLEPVAKCRNDKKVISTLIQNMIDAGYKAGKVYIAHVNNLEFADKIKEAILDKFGTKVADIYPLRGLCSFYAERGGVLIGVECV